ncbi:hypothetical protein BpHYR1_007625 [Brachionus plicatilis]|uniref:Uncharacterized protein n=1 Tax=Brachionus plicatilis TaxID=10195 RepID=A0A3M7RCD2_BRAPC|nr:hypothetical protein BpHYR1_007625 [Brachionus plicatilis]
MFRTLAKATSGFSNSFNRNRMSLDIRIFWNFFHNFIVFCILDSIEFQLGTDCSSFDVTKFRIAHKFIINIDDFHWQDTLRNEVFFNQILVKVWFKSSKLSLNDTNQIFLPIVVTVSIDSVSSASRLIRDLRIVVRLIVSPFFLFIFTLIACLQIQGSGICLGGTLTRENKQLVMHKNVID